MQDYKLHENIISQIDLTLLLRAEDAVARIDEIVRAADLKVGLISRLQFLEAVAVRRLEQELVDLEHLVLLDGHSYSGTMSPDLSSAWHMLAVLRKAERADANRLLASARPGEDVTDDSIRLAEAPDYFYDPNWDEAGRLEAWRDVQKQAVALPPLLAAAIAWDSWLVLEPDQRGSWRAPLLASLTLKARAKTRSLLLPLALGARHDRYRRHHAHTQQQRLEGVLGWARSAADQVSRELSRLVLARSTLNRHLQSRRRSSRVPALVDLLLEKPLVSIPMAAKSLKCSQQAVAVMMRQLGSTPREITDRGRFRAWTVP